MQEAEEHEKKVQELLNGLYAFAENNRNILTDGRKRQTVEMSTGSFGWRMTPRSVSIQGEEEVIETLEQFGLEDFIRIKKEIDKQAILKNPKAAAGIKGITIGQREEFFVKPLVIQVEIVKKLKKVTVNVA